MAQSSGILKRVLLVRGKVQRVGYRGFVLEKAQETGVGGQVKNLPDGRVEVIALGNSETLDRFATAISARIGLIAVNEVQVASEERLDQPQGTFKVVAGSLEEETLEASATGANYLGHLLQDVKGVEAGIGQMNREMQNRFDVLDRRYGEIGETARQIAELLRSIHQEQVGQRAEMRTAMDNNTRAFNEMVSTMRDLQSFLRNGSNRS